MEEITFFNNGLSNQAQLFLGEDLVCGFPVQALPRPPVDLCERVR